MNEITRFPKYKFKEFPSQTMPQMKFVRVNRRDESMKKFTIHEHDLLSFSDVGKIEWRPTK